MDSPEQFGCRPVHHRQCSKRRSVRARCHAIRFDSPNVDRVLMRVCDCDVFLMQRRLRGRFVLHPKQTVVVRYSRSSFAPEYVPRFPVRFACRIANCFVCVLVGVSSFSFSSRRVAQTFWGCDTTVLQRAIGSPVPMPFPRLPCNSLCQTLHSVCPPAFLNRLGLSPNCSGTTNSTPHLIACLHVAYIRLITCMFVCCRDVCMCMCMQIATCFGYSSPPPAGYRNYIQFPQTTSVWGAVSGQSLTTQCQGDPAQVGANPDVRVCASHHLLPGYVCCV